MQGSKQWLVGEWIDGQLRNERNRDVYETRLTAEPPVPGFDTVPRCIYFYYVRIDRNGIVRTDHYFYPNGPAESSKDWQPIPYAEMADAEGIVRTLGHDPNRSFFDAKDLVVEMPVRGGRGRPDTSDNRTAIFLVNHLKDNDDTDLGANGRAARRYKFDMYLRVKYARSGAPAMTVIFDPDGTNTGPST